MPRPKKQTTAIVLPQRQVSSPYDEPVIANPLFTLLGPITVTHVRELSTKIEECEKQLARMKEIEQLAKVAVGLEQPKRKYRIKEGAAMLGEAAGVDPAAPRVKRKYTKRAVTTAPVEPVKPPKEEEVEPDEVWDEEPEAAPEPPKTTAPRLVQNIDDEDED